MMTTLRGYDLMITWLPGKKMVIADHLSRAVKTSIKHDDVKLSPVEQDVSSIDVTLNLAMTERKKQEYKIATDNDDSLQEVK